MTVSILGGKEVTASPSPVGMPSPGVTRNGFQRSSTSSTVSEPESFRSTTSSHANSIHTSFIPLSRTSSISSNFSFASGEVEVVTEEGLCHAEAKLSAKRYKTVQFAQDLLDIIFALRVPTWSSYSEDYLLAEKVKIFKVSGSLTNAVFFISYPDIPSIKTVLLRIYGPASGSLISRPRELHTLHVLSSQYRIGPRVHGTFENGRIEEYFESDALTSEDLRDSTVSRWIGARMAELHCVDVDAIEEDSPTQAMSKSLWDVAAKKNVVLWLKAAMEVLSLPSVDVEFKQAIQIEQFVKDWNRYMDWLSEWEQKHGHSKRVFAHNDAQYGNLLRLRKLKEGLPEHRQIIVVDFEYASPNSAAFDIANHFQEWTANYHGPTPHLLDPSRYPSPKERTNFYQAYVSHTFPPLTTVEATSSSTSSSPISSASAVPSSQNLDTGAENEVRRLESQVRVWSPATHAMWAVWGIVQAREDLEQAARTRAEGGRPDDPEFDYLGYARCRFEGFRREIRALGL